VRRPHAGEHYPRSLGEFQASFRTDADCLDYLEWLRWPTGFVCPACLGRDCGRLGDGRFKRVACGVRGSVTAGTIFDRTRTTRTLRFTACGLFATGKDGIAAQTLKRTLDVGSCQTVWATLHRLRAVLARPGRARLVGTVEVVETYIGGRDLRVGRGKGRGDKVLTGIAYRTVCSGRWRSQRTGAPSGALWGCCAVACTMGSQ
jgi:hypothetical protein